jgi:schlafen family protein
MEFKTKTNQNNGELTKDDRKNLGVILSAFANSMGGLVIWGVLAAKSDDSVDCATEPKPISEIEKFKSEAERALSQAIMPRHEDIRVAAVPHRDGAGYLLIQVERSERRPHRCEDGERQYFKRIGDSSIAMEHYDIEDSFKRMTIPKLTAQFQLKDVGTIADGAGGGFKTLNISVWLKNDSLVTASHPYFLIDDSNVKIAKIFAKPSNYTDGADQVIHPGLSLEVANFHHRSVILTAQVQLIAFK